MLNGKKLQDVGRSIGSLERQTMLWARIQRISLSILIVSMLCMQPSLTRIAAADEKSTSETDDKSGENDDKKKTKKIVPVFTLNRPLLESPVGNDPLFGTVGAETLKSLVSRLEKVKDDEEVAAVVVTLGGASMGRAQLEELRQALLSIRKSGKPVYAHANSLSFGGATLLSAASRISVTPVGDVFVTGIYGEQPHFRGLLDKVRVRPDFLTCGAYKSAGEMYTRATPSPEAAEMYKWLYDGIFDTYLNLLAEGRDQSQDTVREWVDKGVYSARAAAKLKIIDAVEFRDDFVDFVKKEVGEDAEWDKRYGKAKRKTVDLSNPFAVFKIWSDILQGSTKPTKGKKPTVAIVYVEGAIMPGSSQPSPFLLSSIAYSEPIRKALAKLADDDSVKAVVLRVNSPGGSAVASEIILQATKRVAEKKPFVVSMGDVAGSGGYYVACGADTIVADASTITGSIGVVSGKLATREMWETVGVNWHPIARGKNSGMLYSGEVFTDEQRDILQEWMDEVYEDFKGHVTRIRGDRLIKPIEEMAGGRVFTGKQALELGLVDQLGSLSDAIKIAAKKAKLEDYDVRVFPRPKSLLEQMFADLSNDSDDTQLRSDVVNRWKTRQVWDAVAPLVARLQPRRAAALQRAMIQLEILQREGVTLATPELIISP
jgi:protease-4